ncbi:meiotic coiled-coil protein, putative [Entamoeba invadens IP1]|uniref:Meiotic coiled-coil protein, putative n=1 Tax=Entamoeba invadens IP1 TaxID=370355 RepID=A0A0A1TYS9_ENTIV|nr:meiotic coiled-coil protein, putative [Entamoeba invadens IP1]ELP84730.1 meiotic coiled-coil protein, putative [Entamoeba invadens IP1]|eukprot:XP_004184076.1 meiotic coiled-coil protein, putative [Entamoeba invadens IP1]
MIPNMSDNYDTFSHMGSDLHTFNRYGSPIHDEKEIPDFITQLLDEQPDPDPQPRVSFTAPQTPNPQLFQGELEPRTEPITPFKQLSCNFIPKQRICKFYQTGNCRYGENCKFLHVKSTEPFEKFSKSSYQPFSSFQTFSPQSFQNPENFPKMCRDQVGCRFLQQQLEEGNTGTLEYIYQQIVPLLDSLMIDPFGNYLCQKLIEVVKPDQRVEIIEEIGDKIHTISRNIYGTRSVQKLINSASSKNEVNLIRKYLEPYVINLIFDINGNHVIQECLKVFDKPENSFIFDAILENGNLVRVSSHKHGCCVVQRCIDNGNEEQLSSLVNDIVKYSLALVKDAFGNYVVQYVLGIEGVSVRVTNCIIENLIELSMQKFSSNVIEKLVATGNCKVKEIIFEQFLKFKDVAILLQDSFANYVIQTCLDKSWGEYKLRLSNWIIPHVGIIKNTPYYKKIQGKLVGVGNTRVLSNSVN